MDNNLKVGIYIPTLNKPEFIIRQIKYYASRNSPHAVYIGDDSNEENAEILRKGLEKFKDKLDIHYFHGQEPITQAECQLNLISNIKEKYAIFSGDDDFLVPNSLTKCAEFLEKNPDFSLASGLAISFNLDRPGPYGDIASMSDYRRPEVLEEKATERLFNYLGHYHVTLFSVARKEDLKKDWELSLKAQERSFQTEVMQGCLAIVRGKSKTLDHLSIIRQMHDTRQAAPDIFDWITRPNWAETYKYFSEILSREIMEKDSIKEPDAKNIVKKAMWLYLQNQLTSANRQPRSNKGGLKFLKKAIVKLLPYSKTLFFKYVGSPNKSLHYQVHQPWSSYYRDFQGIIEAVTLLQ